MSTGSGGDDDYGARIRASVMTNPLILERVAGYLSRKPVRSALKKRWETSHGQFQRQPEVDHLLHLRSTCTQWNRIFTPHIKRHHAVIRLGEPCGDGPFQPVGPALEELTNLKRAAAEAGREFPFSRFQLPLAPRWDHPHLDSFLSEFGTIVTRLELVWSSPSTFSCIPIAQLRSIVFEKTPSLEELVLYPNDYERPEGASMEVDYTQAVVAPNLKKVKVTSGWLPSRLSLAQFLVKVCESAPKLKSIKIAGGASSEGCVVLPVLDGVANSPTTHIFSQLRSLKLGITTNAMLEILVQGCQPRRGQCQMRLETFAAKFSGYSLGEEEISEVGAKLHSFLISQAPTLKILKLGFRSFHGRRSSTPGADAALFHLPRMDHLCEFCLQRLECEPNLLAVRIDGGDGYCDPFPKLWRFVHHYTSSQWEEGEDSRAPSVIFSPASATEQLIHAAVTHLEVTGMTKEQLLQFADRFPAVEQLDIRLENWSSEFEEGWALWPKLVKLNGVTREEVQ